MFDTPGTGSIVDGVRDGLNDPYQACTDSQLEADCLVRRRAAS